MKTEEQTPHGEAALLEQINNLQKQLDDCLETDFKWGKSNALRSALENTIAAQFMPVSKYNEYHKEWVKETPYDNWWNFRSSIFEGDRSARLLQSQAFRDVIWCMNNFIADMEGDKADFELFTSSAELIIDNTTAEGWGLALEALDLGREGNLQEEDYQWLRLSILNIQRCVNVWHGAGELPESPFH